MVNIIRDRDLILDVHDYTVVLVGTSILNQLSNGFQRKVGVNFPEVYEACKLSGLYGDPRRLGTWREVDTSPAFVLCYITKGRFRPDIRPDTLDYDALEKCLEQIVRNFPGEKIATTLLGTSLYDGNGDREKVLAIFEKIFTEQDIWVYDYEQRNWLDERTEKWGEVISKMKSDEYTDAKKKFYWEDAFGIYVPVPYELTLQEVKKLAKEQIKKRKEL